MTDLFNQPPCYSHKENNIESQQIFDTNKTHFSKQCIIVLDALKRGERLTTTTALLKYGIGDLRRRIKDLIDIHKIDVKAELQQGRFKVWFLDK